jgi:uncharacterized protein YbdZ (MbtH family)
MLNRDAPIKRTARPPLPPLRALSLGWGVQSFTLAAMVALGELPAADIVIDADTHHEKRRTYAFKQRWAPWLAAHGLHLVTVSDPSAQSGAAANRSGGIFIPAFTYNGQTKGQLRRQCTSRWKIRPIRRYLKAQRGPKPSRGPRRPVELWLGISTDEAGRMRDSDAKYITNTWPLIEMQLSRSDCIAWLEAHGLEIPPKSACTFCPYQTMAAWNDLAQEEADLQEAISMDRRIRKARPPFDLFVHPARRPLEDVIGSQTPDLQYSLWDEECSGICGV